VSFLLSIASKPVMLSVFILSVVMMNVVAPYTAFVDIQSKPLGQRVLILNQKMSNFKILNVLILKFKISSVPKNFMLKFNILKILN
jgi:hypothetical protein